MRIAVTGATGNVGSRLVPLLAADPDVTEVIAIARRRPEEATPGVTWTELDVTEDDLRPALEGTAAVVHLAWLVQPSRDLMRLWEVNVLGTMRLLRAAADVGVGAIVHASSVGAYSPGPDDGHAVTEDWPTHGVPSSSYSREKAYVERLLDIHELRYPSSRVVRMRPALIFGEHAATRVRRLFLGSLFPNVLAGRWPVGRIPRVRGLTFQAVHTDDVARAYHAAAVKEVAGPFNLAAEPVLSLEDVAGMLDVDTFPLRPGLVRGAAAASWAARLHPIGPGWFDLAMSAPTLDTNRARDVLGWEPAVDATGALEELFEGVREGTGGPTPPLAEDEPERRVEELRSSRQGADEMRP